MMTTEELAKILSGFPQGYTVCTQDGGNALLIYNEREILQEIIGIGD
jgi:hypothetical protein